MGEVSGGEVIRLLACVEFVLEGNLEGIFGECDVTESTVFGVDTGNTTDEEISRGEIEGRGKSKCGDGGGGVDFGFSSGELTYGTIGETVSVREDGGETWNGDVSGKEVSYRTSGVGIFIPNVCFGSELKFFR